MARRRQFKFQFRLVWRYQGQSWDRKLVSDRPEAILRMLRRIGTDEPWLGVFPTQFKRSWAWVGRRLDLTWDAVKTLSPRAVLLTLRDSYPKLEYIRVETRQVGDWTTMLDPLANLRTPSTPKADKKKADLLAMVEAMTPEQLDAWRWVPDETLDRLTRRRDANTSGRRIKRANEVS